MSEIREVLIEKPMVVATAANSVILMSESDAQASPVDIFAHAQLYRLDDDIFSPVLTFGSFGNFIPEIALVEPPEPFVRPN